MHGTFFLQENILYFNFRCDFFMLLILFLYILSPCDNTFIIFSAFIITATTLTIPRIP